MNYGEADRILTVFTEGLGKIKVLAKGVRKISSKLAGNLEPYNILNLELREGKAFHTITSAEIAEYFDCHEEFLASSQAVYLAEIVDKVFEEEEKNVQAFNIFAESLSCLNNRLAEATYKDDDGSHYDLILRLFELKILDQAGFKPDLFHCSKCKRKLEPGGNYVNKLGDLQCKECVDATAENMPDNVIKILRLMQERGVNIAGKIRCADTERKIAENYLDQLLQNALERELKSKKYLS